MGQSKRRIIRGLFNDTRRQFTYGFANVFFVLFFVLIINSLSIYKFSQISNLCLGIGGEFNAANMMSYLNFMGIASAIAILLTGLLSFFFIILLTHRFFGPLVAISRHLDELKAGNFTSRIRLREKDELKSLCQQLNDLTEVLQKNYEQRRNPHES